MFVHAAPCPRFDAPDEVAPIVCGRLISVCAYDTADQCLYELGHAGEGETVHAPLARALDDPRTSFLNIHTAKPGCLALQGRADLTPPPGLRLRGEGEGGAGVTATGRRTGCRGGRPGPPAGSGR
ncbi:MAG: DUF1203 domain-containing protein [Pseudomonadota bacterium]|nr:DUF1203 domain-containing protein [Pseudomonadota bacterium]